MQYRKFGKLDWKCSALGFGAMRLPSFGEGHDAKVNEEEAIKMIRYALDNGVNYIDFAYMYHMGDSETIVGKALKNGYRQKIKMATKMPARMIEKADDFERIFNEQIKKLDIDKIDFYLLHGLDAVGWKKMKEFKYFDWAEKKVSEGLIGRLGFSFHDKYEVFEDIVKGYDNWVLAQIQYNYMDENEQAGRKGVELAASKGIAIVVMEPLRGGKLAKNPPPKPVAEVLAKAKRQMTNVEWALQWVWNQPEVSLALSGMSSMQQVVDNLKYAERAKPGIFKAADLQVIKDIKVAYKSLTPIGCTQCKYCQPCPQKVEIPQVFQIYNEAFMYDDMKGGQFAYNAPFAIPQDKRADQCTRCEECLAKCPQKLPIPDLLEKAHAALYLKNPPPPPGTPRKKTE